MNSFFRELKERKVYRVALGYWVVAWLVVQIASTVLPTFHVPEWVLQALTVTVALGFPVALVLAWAFDVTPSGVEKTSEGVGTVAARKETQRLVACRSRSAHRRARHRELLA